MKNEKKNSSVKGSLRVVWCHLVVRNITEKNIYWHFNDLFKQRDINLFISISDHLPPFSYTLEGSFFAQLPNITDFFMVQQIPSCPKCQTGLRIQNVISGWLRATLTELLGLPSLYVSVLGSTASSASRIFSTGISSLKLLVDSTSLSPRSFPRCRSSWTAVSKNQHASGPRKKKNCMTKPWSH